MLQKAVSKQSYQYIVYPSGGNAAMYSRVQTVIKIRMLSFYRQSQASSTRCRNSAMVVAGSGERVGSASPCPIHVQLARDLGILQAKSVVVH